MVERNLFIHAALVPLCKPEVTGSIPVRSKEIGLENGPFRFQPGRSKRPKLAVDTRCGRGDRPAPGQRLGAARWLVLSRDGANAFPALEDKPLRVGPGRSASTDRP